jgi:NhaP-type Na+/H+ or K+/H+ antiporter
MSLTPSLQMTLALGLGVLVQTAAHHLKLPGILLLLATGVLCGPAGFHVIDPHSFSGATLDTMIAYAVAVILFEGGLALSLPRLSEGSKAVRGLLIIGPLVTLAGAIATVSYFLGWPLKIAFLFGTLVVVTGPTVVTPLLKRMAIHDKVASILEAEGILIDAVGAVLATVGLTVALSSDHTLFDGGFVFIESLAFGTLAGGVLGWTFHQILSREWIPHDLEKVTTLCVMISLFQVCNLFIHESGVAAVIAAGAVMAHFDPKNYEDVCAFKEQLI